MQLNHEKDKKIRKRIEQDRKGKRDEKNGEISKRNES